MGNSFLIRVSSLSLSLLLLTSLASPLPAPGPCTGFYDCTSTENSLFTHLARLPDISACQTRCQEDARCNFFTFNYKQESLYPGACFLLPSCALRRPGARQWVSGSRDCPDVANTPANILPASNALGRNFQNFLIRTQ